MGSSDQRKFLRSLLIPALFVLLLWMIRIAEVTGNSDFSGWGIRPLHSEGIAGIFFYVFLHGNWAHLIDNSVPVLILGTAMFYFYSEVAVKAILTCWLLGGFWLWLGGRPDAWHIGASGLIYSMATFLFFSGIFRKFPRLMALSLLVVFLYGSMIWGIFPYDLSISWEGHLFGAVAGIVMAVYYRHTGPGSSPGPVLEEEEEDDPDAYWNQPDPEKQEF